MGESASRTYDYEDRSPGGELLAPSLQYVAPELLAASGAVAAAPLSPAADIFSLGELLLRMKLWLRSDRTLPDWCMAVCLSRCHQSPCMRTGVKDCDNRLHSRRERPSAAQVALRTRCWQARRLCRRIPAWQMCRRASPAYADEAVNHTACCGTLTFIQCGSWPAGDLDDSQDHSWESRPLVSGWTSD